MRFFTLYTLLGVVLLSAAAPTVVDAATVLRAGSDASVSSEQSVVGDLYLTRGLYERTTMSGTVGGDVYAAGSAVMVDGTVAEDVFVLAGTAQVTASTSDDVRVVAADTTISGTVGGDVFVLAGTLEVLPEAVISGDVLVFAGTATIAGEIGGSLFGAVEQVRIDGTVGGDVDLRAPAGIILGDAAVIEGSVVYASRDELVRAPNSVINGEVQERSLGAVNDGDSLQSLLTPLFMLLFSILTVYLLGKPQLQLYFTLSTEKVLLHVAIGAGVLLAGPIVAGVLLLTVLAAPLGMLLAALLLFVAVLGAVLSGLTLVALIGLFFRQSFQVSLLSVIAGTSLVYFLVFVPVLGGLLVTALYCVSVGALVRYMYLLVKGE